MAKVLCTLGYAIVPEVRERVGYEVSCALADGSLPEPAGSLGDTEPAGRGRAMRRGDRRLRRRRRRGGRRARRGRGRRGRAGGRWALHARHLPARPDRGDHLALPRGRADRRRGPPAGPGAGGARGRRHHGDQLGDLLPRPGAGAAGTGVGVRRRLGHRPRRRVLRGRGVPARHARSTPSGWAATASWRWRGRGRSARAAARSAATPATACSAAPVPFGCAIDAKRGMHVSYLPRAVAAGARVRQRVEVQRILVEDGRAVGVECLAAASGERNGAPAPLHASAPGP